MVTIKTRTIAASLLLGSVGTISFGPQAIAQPGATAGSGKTALEEIVITAQRRDQNLQQVPISVTALSERDVQEMGLKSSTAIGDVVPNLEFKTVGGTLNITIRGVGNNDFNSAAVSPVSVYRDGVVVGSNAPQTFALLDLDHIEVLRGPQGTLFGKNTTGGALQYFSKLPGEEVDGNLRATVGNFDLLEVEGAATLHLGTDFSVRVSGLVRNRDGTKRNLVDNRKLGEIDEWVARAIFRYNPGDLDAKFHLGSGRAKNEMNFQKPVGTLPGGTNAVGWNYPDSNDLDVWNVNGENFNEVEDTYAILDISYQMGDYTLRSLTGYDDGSGDYISDSDGSPLRVLERDVNKAETTQFTQELQISFQSMELQWVAGLYYFDEDYEYDLRLDFFGLLGAAGTGRYYKNTRDNTSYAAYAQGTFSLTEALRITAGVRYTYDEVEATATDAFRFGEYVSNPDPSELLVVLPLTKDDYDSDAVDWRLALEYDMADDVMVYASVTQGSKPGSTRAAGVVNSPAELGTYDPEDILAYEAGIKSTWLDNRLRVNAGVFYYDYTDLQVQSVREGEAGMTSILVENAADAKIKGMEVEISALPFPQLEAGINFGWVDGEYKNYVSGAVDALGNLINFSGNELPNTPEFNMSANLVFTQDIGDFDVRLRADYSHTDERFTNSAQDPLISTLDGHYVLNLRGTLTPRDGGPWEVSLWGQNVTGEKYVVEALDLRSLGFIPYEYGETEPTYGIDVAYRF